MQHFLYISSAGKIICVAHSCRKPHHLAFCGEDHLHKYKIIIIATFIKYLLCWASVVGHLGAPLPCREYRFPQTGKNQPYECCWLRLEPVCINCMYYIKIYINICIHKTAMFRLFIHYLLSIFSWFSLSIISIFYITLKHQSREFV